MCSVELAVVIQSSCCSLRSQNNPRIGNLELTPDLEAWSMRSPVAGRSRRVEDFPVVDGEQLRSSGESPLNFLHWSAYLVYVCWRSRHPQSCWEWLTFSLFVETKVCYCTMLVSDLWPVTHLMCRVSKFASDRIVTEVALTQWLLRGGMIAALTDIVRITELRWPIPSGELQNQTASTSGLKMLDTALGLWKRNSISGLKWLM